MILRFWIGLVLGFTLLLFGGSSITGFGATEISSSGTGTVAFLIAGLCIFALVVLNFLHEEKITEE